MDEIERMLGFTEADQPALDRAFHNVVQMCDLKFKMVDLARANGVTREMIAVALGVSVEVVKDFESYSGNPRIGTMTRYAHAARLKFTLDVSIDADDPENN